jgi:dienelactone hydrolase
MGRTYGLLLILLAGCSDATNMAGGDGGGGGGGGDMGGGGGQDGGGSNQRLPSKTGTGTFTIPGRQESMIEVVVPSPLPANPPVVIGFHSTGGEPSEAISDFQLDQNAPAKGFIAIAPRAGYRNGIHPADVDHDTNEGDSSWNMWAQDVASNEDLQYVLALIDAAKLTYNADTSRVYTMGFSNGAFMSYFVAASLPDKIAGFGENSGGWTTDSCPARGPNDSNGLGFYPMSGPAAGQTVTCATLYASSSPQFPAQCTPTASNHLRPPPAGTRIPFGYLAHYSSDDTVSVEYSCFLFTALGSRVTTNIRYSDTDGTKGHNMQPDFFDKAWSFFALRTNAQ